MPQAAKPVSIASLAKLKGTAFCEMRLNGNLKRATKKAPSTIQVSVPESWIDDLFREFGLGQTGDSEYFLMRVKKAEIPD